MSSGQVALGQQAMADRLGVTPRRLRDLGKLGIVPRRPDGRYEPNAVTKAYCAYREGYEQARAAGFGNLEYEAARARLTRARADAIEACNRERRRELVERGDVEATVRAPLAAVLGVLDAAPGRHAKALAKRLDIPEVDARKLVAELLQDARAELA